MLKNSTILSNPDSRAALIGSLFVMIAAFGFSAKAILIKMAYALGPVDAIGLLALRMAMALPFFLVAAIWAGRNDPPVRAMNRADWLIILGLGITGYYFASFLDFQGLTYISAGLERLILFLYPTLVVLFSALVYRKPVAYPEIFALLLSYVGIGLVVSENFGEQKEGLWVGVGLVFGSAVSFACYMMGSGLMIRRIGPHKFTCYSMIAACLATGFHFSLQGGTSLLGLPLSVYGLALLMALLSTVLPTFFMNAGIRRLGSGTASIISSVGPVVTLVLAYFLLDERLSAVQLLGTGLVLVGVYLVTRYASGRGI